MNKTQTTFIDILISIGIRRYCVNLRGGKQEVVFLWN